MEITVCESHVIIKPNTGFKSIGVIVALMGCMGINLLIHLFPLKEDYTLADISGVAFVCLWLVVLLWMGVSSLRSGFTTITVDENGVVSKALFRRKSYCWEEIKDFGIFYSGQDRWEGNTYSLYFSTELQRTKDLCRKKLGREIIKTYIVGNVYYDVVGKLFPYCTAFTEVEPFIAEHKTHII